MSYTPSNASLLNGGYLKPNTVVFNQNGIASQAAFIGYNDLKPFEMVELFERNAPELPFRMLLKGMGFNRVVGSPYTGHYEVGKNVELMNVGSVVSGGASPGVNVTIALAASNMFQNTIGSTNYDTSFPDINDVWETTAGDRFYVVSKNSGVNPNQLELRPWDATVQGNVAISAGTVMRWIGTSYAEGTDTGRTRSARVVKYQNTFHTSKAGWSATGTALTTEAYWNPVPGQPGAFTARLKPEMMDRYQQDIDNMLVFGQQTTNITNTNATLGIVTPQTSTQGMVSFVEDYGFEFQIIPGQRTIQDFYDIVSTFEGERVHSKEYLSLIGKSALYEYEQVFADYGGRYNFQSGFTLTNTEDEKMTLKLGAASITLGDGYTFALKSFGIFNQNNGAGASGFEWPEVAIYTPMGFLDTKDATGNKPMSGYEVRGSGSVVREDLICMVDGTGAYTAMGGSTVDITRMGILSEFCWHGTCPNNTAIQRP